MKKSKWEVYQCFDYVKSFQISKDNNYRNYFHADSSEEAWELCQNLNQLTEACYGVRKKRRKF